jgi:hypothetical protein
MVGCEWVFRRIDGGSTGPMMNMRVWLKKFKLIPNDRIDAFSNHISKRIWLEIPSVQ